MKRSFSPLRYPGGKASIYDLASDIIISHDMQSCQYAEPYAGGCGLALALLFEGVVDELYLNDIDPSIASLWQTILEQPNELVKLITTTKLDMDEWYRQKAIQNDKANVDPLSLAFSTLYLNRTNRSGIIKAGVIGGKAQSGFYKMDCRFNKDNIIKRIYAIADRQNKIHIFNLDAIEFIGQLENLALSKPLLMIDPPYYNKGQQLYTNFYKHEDHVNIANKLSETKLPWLLTYDNTPEISELYKEFAQYEFNISYTLATKRKGNELLITSHSFGPIQHNRVTAA